jgi:hypothetical protein
LVLLLTVPVCLSAFCGNAFAAKIGYNGRTTTSHPTSSCKHLLRRRNVQDPVRRSDQRGGNWATPAAQAAAKVDETKTDIGTKNVGCHVD